MARTRTGTSRAVTCATTTDTPGTRPSALAPGVSLFEHAASAVVPASAAAPRRSQAIRPRRVLARWFIDASWGRPQGSREPAQEIRALLAELGVGCLEAG